MIIADQTIPWLYFGYVYVPCILVYPGYVLARIIVPWVMLTQGMTWPVTPIVILQCCVLHSCNWTPSVAVSVQRCNADDPGSIPGPGKNQRRVEMLGSVSIGHSLSYMGYWFAWGYQFLATPEWRSWQDGLSITTPRCKIEYSPQGWVSFQVCSWLGIRL